MKSVTLIPRRASSWALSKLHDLMVRTRIFQPAPIGLASTIIAGLAGGFLLGQQAGAAPPPILAEVVETPMEAIRPMGVDIDGDGRLDLAWPVENAVRGVDAYGSGAFGASRDGGRRVHRGVDFVAAPGEPVRAPIAGVVTRIGDAYAGQDGLTYVEITNLVTRYTARILYVGSEVQPGGVVAAGDIIGRAQNLIARYPAGMTNHVHVELTGRLGGRLDPLVVLPKGPGVESEPTA